MTRGKTLGKMMLTRRDLDLINFLEDYHIASTTTLKRFFFPSLTTCQKRLKTLYDCDRVQRVRLTMNDDYVYYLKKPKQFMHALIITEFYGKLSNEVTVINYKVQKKLGKIIPDSIFLYKVVEREHIGMLEVELSNNGFNYEKYEEFYRTGAYKEWFPFMPNVYVVCRSARLPANSPVKFIRIKYDLSDFRL